MSHSRRWYLLLGGLMVAAILFVALFAEKLTSVSPYYMDANPMVIMGSPPFPPGPHHPLGTDEWGRDVWTRIAYGTRWSLFFAALVMGARLAVAVPLAVAAAFGPRFAGWLLGRLYVYTSAIPPLLVYLMILSNPRIRVIGLWPSATIAIGLLALVEWPRLAIVLRGRMEELGTEQFVEGAIAVGASPWRIFWNHLMPHLWPTLIHLAVAEMGRAMLVVAQLGVFGIWVGGGIQEIIEISGREVWIFTTGVPEWGTLLADARRWIYGAPWIPMAPAFAFLFGVVGFNLLSQGLEGIQFSVSRWREATAGRLSPRWRWVFAAVPVIAGLTYYGGLPWGREEGVAELAMRQTQALTGGSVEDYLATLAPGEGQYRTEQRRWAERLVTGDYQVVVVKPGQVKVSGDEATASWTVSVGFRDKPPTSLVREVQLVRRWGRWYDAGESFTTQRGIHADLEAFFVPTDPSREATRARGDVYFLATAADHAYERVMKYFPAVPGAERPRLKLYPSHDAFRQAIAGELAAENVKSKIWYSPGQSIRVSPAFLQGYNRRDIERALSYEMLKFLAVSRLGASASALPVLMGTYELESSQGSTRLDFDQLAVAPLFGFGELMSAGPGDLPQERQRVYVSQTAMLAEFLGKSLSKEELLGAMTGSADVVGSLAGALGLSEEQFAAAYDGYVYNRIAGASMINIPAGRERIPVALSDAVERRARAASSGDGQAFAALAEPRYQMEQAEWLEAARKSGLSRYEATLLDMEKKGAYSNVYVLERVTMADGTVSTGVLIQPWTEHEGGWVAGAVTTVWKPTGEVEGK